MDTACSPLPKDCLSAPMMGHMGENLISVHPNIDKEIGCRSLCQAEDQCNFFTYFGSNDLRYPETCFLLSTLKEPFMNLNYGYGQDFVTGTKKCLTNSQCELIVAEKNTTSASEMFTEVLDYTSKVHAVAVGTCSLTVVAVGGGGDSCDTCNGGGSGYVEWEQISVKGSLMLDLRVGGPGRVTAVKVASNWGGVGGPGGPLGTLVVQAEGGTYEGGEGGHGYSGGGGDGTDGAGGGDGGSDGGDGQDGSRSAGGKGSGLDVSTIPVTGFRLRGDIVELSM